MTQTQEPNQNNRALHFAREYVKPELKYGKDEKVFSHQLGDGIPPFKLAVQLTLIQTASGNLYTIPRFSGAVDRHTISKEVYTMPYHPAQPIGPNEDVRRVYEGISLDVWNNRLKASLQEKIQVAEFTEAERKRIYPDKYWVSGRRTTSARDVESKIRSLDEELVVPDELEKGRTLVQKDKYYWELAEL